MPTWITVMLNGSESGTSYRLYRNDLELVSSITGNGNPLYWPIVAPGNYSVRAYRNGIERLMNGVASVTEMPRKTVSVEISADNNGVCQGTAVHFAAVASNEGTNPIYQWQVNGVVIGNSSPAFTYVPAHNDVVTLRLTSSEQCTVENPVLSNVIVMQVNPALPVSVVIGTESNTICQGSYVSIHATGTNAGVNPVYQWKVNGNTVGGNTPVYSYIPSNNDVVSVQLTSNLACATNNPANSNAITMAVNPLMPVSVSIQASENNVCQGTTVSFTASGTNAGANPVYQWKVNGNAVGSNTPVYSYIPSNNDVVSVQLTSNLACATNNPANSNAITMAVNPLMPVSVSIQASENNVCQGTTVSFTASGTNAGANPVYQWKVNGNTVGGNTPVYSYIPSNNDVVSVELTSNLACATNNPANSNTINMQINEILPVEVSISASQTNVCDGTEVSFEAVGINAGTAPVHQWFVNGMEQGGNSPFFSYIPNHNDEIFVKLTSSEECTVNNPANSNTVSIQVYENLLVEVSITASQTSVCEGTEVSFEAVGVNAGTAPVYLWMVNGIQHGINSKKFDYVPENADKIQVQLTSSEECTLNNPVLSNYIEMLVHPLPDVSWTEFEPDTLCIFWEAVLLTGGLPSGGQYSGPGVIDGYFYPAEASIGNHVLTYHYTDANNCSAESYLPVFVDYCTNLEEQPSDAQKQIVLAPNPSSGTISVFMPLDNMISNGYKIMTALGELLLREQQPIGHQTVIDISSLSNGIYYLELNIQSQTVIKRFVVIRQ